MIKISYKRELDEVFEKIVQAPNVIVAIKHYGEFEIMAVAPFENFEKIWKLNEEISQIEGIKKVEIFFDEAFQDWPINLYSHLL